ncbi:MAG: Peptidase propeptide and domain [Thermoleophilaceae bacterium]|nr:Peptidase propeptide and domain [Thermoleophilaceae bacterium]
MRIPLGKSAAALAAVAALAAGGTGVASGSNGSNGSNGSKAPSRLDDGKQYLPQAKVSESRAIRAAQRAASGGLNEVDLEQYAGRLCWNVDVGAKNVKVDAETGKVLDANHAD